ncbi:isochorismate synthase [Labilibacter sediminis]|nr:isochorismate synthase [Labilibacter sediminis]
MQSVTQKEVLTYCIQHQIPFAISKLPGTSENNMIVSEHVKQVYMNDLFNDSQYDGFVMAPFSLSDEKASFLNASYTIEENVENDVFRKIKLLKGEVLPTEEAFYADYVSYQEQFNHMFKAITEGEVSKVILSRIKPFKGFSKDLAADFYYTLSETYVRAYVFMVYTPESGLWAGASPELLLKADHKMATTVSLAGTQKWSSNIDQRWNEKEIDEQQIVSDFIHQSLQKFKVNQVTVNGPETIKAGKMSHLKTEYKFPVEAITKQMGSFIQEIHPTPAVCGLPKDKSMDMIHSIEPHNRSYYAGFLGTLSEGNVNLYVNIRSMRFADEGVDLYLGGGLTKGSDAEKEWNETELKAETLLSVIKEVKSAHKK